MKREIFLIFIIMTAICLFWFNKIIFLNEMKWIKSRRLNDQLFENGVPKIIHYTYSSGVLPIQYKPQLDSCIKHNPDVKFMFWTDDVAHRFIKKYFPDRLAVYESYLVKEPEKLKKSDILRLMIVYHYGGIYMDLDNLCQRPFRDVMKEHSCMFTTDSDTKTQMYNIWPEYMSNSFFSCIKRHRFLEYVLNAIGKNNGQHIFAATGPVLHTTKYREYKRIFPPGNTTDPLLTIALAKFETFFQVLGKEAMISTCKGAGKAHPQRIMACKGLPEYLKVYDTHLKNATIVHLNLGLGYSRHGGNIKNTYNVSSYGPIQWIQSHYRISIPPSHFSIYSV